MKNYTFHWELKNLVIQFMSAMDECVIKRYDENADVEKEIEVRYVYAPKTRTIHWLVNSQQHITLPVVSVWISGVSRDPSRVFNKIDGPLYSDGDNSTPLQPVPVNIAMNISILTKYQNDMDQIVSNFVPYFDPYIILSWQHPTVDREIRSEVEWNGNLTYTYPTELDANKAYRVAVDTSFTIKGWMFKKSGSPINEIHTVYSNFFGVSGFEVLGDLYE